MPRPTHAWLYVLRLYSGALYIGSTINLGRRWEQHRAGKASRTTARDPPLEIVLVERHSTFSSSRRREAQLKRWSRSKKEALVRGDMEQLRQLSARRKP